MNSTAKVVARRAAVTVGVLGSLGLGAATIDAAAQWTAAAAPMQAPPVSAASLASQLATEQARGTDLQSRLQAAITQASQVQAALDAANARIAADGGTAKALRAQITAAEMRLAALNGQAAAAASLRAVVDVKPVVNGKPAASAKTAAAPSAVAPGTAQPKTNATTGASGAPASGEIGDD